MIDTVIYEVRQYVIPANGFTEETIPAQSVRILNATGSLALAFGQTGSFQRIEAGLGVRTVEPFERVKFQDLSGDENTVLVAYAGRDVADSRLTITGGLLGVKDPGAGAESFSDVVTALEGVTAAMREASQLRAPQTTLEGATYYEAVNTTTTVLSAVANTGGFIIRSAGVQVQSGNGVAAVRLDDDELLYALSNNTDMIANGWNIHVPAGVKIDLYSAAAANKAWLWGEAL